MNCANCAAPISDDAKYCSNCGYMLESFGTPQLIVKPLFSPLSVLISVIPVQIFFTLWGTVVFGIVSFFLIDYFELTINPWIVAIIIGAIFFILTPAIATFLILQRYSRTEYRFYRDHLECEEGLFSTQHKIINLDNIIEVNLQQSFWDRLFNLGTIVLSTAAKGEKTGSLRSGIRIVDIPQPKDAYRAIQRIIDLAHARK
ncbi:MAG: PH domain-containing protein [Spirochaetes bacterium]|nr:PH domain-containing protein [Spirochaetota bacterium]